MPNKLAHFAIEADDVDRARKFYETVFQWQFMPWGPPGFYLIQGAGVHGALQQRREPMPEGRKGFECSFAVNDLQATIKLIKAAGGQMIGSRHTIPTIGELSQFVDTESNEAIIVQYTPERMKELGLS
jgi:uncharacterized protein